MTDPSLKVYRKRRTAGVLIRAAVIILAALVLLSVLFFFGLRKYISYTDTGRLYLDIPWLAGYMDGKPEDDPLSSELTLTGGAGRADLPPEEEEIRDVQDEAPAPDPYGDGTLPETGESGAAEAPSGEAVETPSG